MTGIANDDAEADALAREIKSRQGWQEAELLQRAIEMIERLRERIAVLEVRLVKVCAWNEELRAKLKAKSEAG